MLEIKKFKADYIDDATKLFTVSFERERSRSPLIPKINNIVDEVSGALLKIEKNRELPHLGGRHWWGIC